MLNRCSEMLQAADLLHGANVRDGQPASSLSQHRRYLRDRYLWISWCARSTTAERFREVSAVSPSDICAKGMYIVGKGSRLRPLSRVLPTMPTIWRAGSAKGGPRARRFLQAVPQRISLRPVLFSP